MLTPMLGTSYPGDTTLETAYALFSPRTGLSPSGVRLSRRLLNENLRSILVVQTTPHCQSTFIERLQFALCGFHSPLLTASHLISFPPGTETFHFPGLLLLSEQSCEVAFGDVWFNGYVRLARPYRSLSRPSSTIEPSYPPSSVT